MEENLNTQDVPITLMEQQVAEIITIRKMIHAYIVTVLSDDNFEKFTKTFNSSKTTYESK